MSTNPGLPRQPHTPVLYQEIIHALRPQSNGLYVDGTVGAGGHARGILEASSPTGKLLAMDLDPGALALAEAHLAAYQGRFTLVQASYTSLPHQLNLLGWQAVDGILVDLGLSSMQVDTPERGFSFMQDGPLDMRFDPRSPVTAASLVNELDERELADILFQYGEERRSRQIARAIVKARPLHTTLQLAEVIARSSRSGHQAIHPATRTFQALRIAVNGELDAVSKFLPQAVAALKPGGRVAVIAFHSLEDRLVKQFFRTESRDCICPPKQPVCTCGHKAVITEVTRQPIQAQPEEINQNPRSRSARLRVAQKI